ncbi:MAG: hypothetical protein KBT56_04625 [Paraperlucidibaca sp.]|nr:hypothetical protein [Paraperlucidibaca sp.]
MKVTAILVALMLFISPAAQAADVYPTIMAMLKDARNAADNNQVDALIVQMALRDGRYQKGQFCTMVRSHNSLGRKLTDMAIWMRENKAAFHKLPSKQRESAIKRADALSQVVLLTGQVEYQIGDQLKRIGKDFANIGCEAK